MKFLFDHNLPPSLNWKPQMTKSSGSMPEITITP
jgi:hypothetical protein